MSFKHLYQIYGSIKTATSFREKNFKTSIDCIREKLIEITVSNSNYYKMFMQKWSKGKNM